MVDIARKYENDPLMRAVSLGVEVQHFIDFDPVGKHLIERAHQDRINALEALATTEPSDVQGITALQWQAKIPDLFLSWLDQTLSAASAAEETIRLEEADDSRG